MATLDSTLLVLTTHLTMKHLKVKWQYRNEESGCRRVYMCMMHEHKLSREETENSTGRVAKSRNGNSEEQVKERRVVTLLYLCFHCMFICVTSHYKWHIASLARGLSQLPHLKVGTGCRPNWKRPPVPLTVSNALLKHFYFSPSTAVKHVLADFCNAPSVRL